MRQIHVVTQNVFDPSKPGEDKALFRLADRLHIVTKPAVIERQVLMKPGDAYSPEAAAESERILRHNRYLYDAQIRPIPVGDGEVDLEVVTRDVWTLQGGVGFHRSGGANTVHFDVQDINFLGAGKGISLSHESSVDRTSNLVSYDDPSLFGTHGRMDATYANNSDGSLRSLLLERPFYSLDTRWALGGSATLDDRVDPLYDHGHVIERFQHQEDVVGIYGGLSPGISDRHTHRWLAGFSVERDRFAPAAGFEPPAELPGDRTLAYPWVSYEYLQDGYFTARDMDRIQRTEDVNVGHQFHLRLGYSSTAWGGTLDRVLVDTSASIGWRPSPRQLLLTGFRGGSRFGGGGAENLQVGGNIRYYVRDFGDNLLYVALGGDVVHNLDPEHQLLLGGDTGLRGYPLRFVQGDQRFLFTLEQRFFSDRELFHLHPPGSGDLLRRRLGLVRGRRRQGGGESQAAQGRGPRPALRLQPLRPRLHDPPRPRLPLGRRLLHQAGAVAGVDERDVLRSWIGWKILLPILCYPSRARFAATHFRPFPCPAGRRRGLCSARLARSTSIPYNERASSP